jgi:hypothetical protein
MAQPPFARATPRVRYTGGMGFGKNPHVARAQAAEQKAVDAGDDGARARAYRDAAHQWDRAAERETPGKRRSEYERNAVAARNLADNGVPPEGDGEAEGDGEGPLRLELSSASAAPGTPKLLN